MKCAVVFVALAALLAVAHAQEPDEYIYINYFSTSECTDFRGSKAAGNHSYFTLSGASGGSCGRELECMVNPLSRGCARIFSGEVTAIEIVVRDDSDEFEVYNNFALEPTIRTADECIKSAVYENCWYRLQRKEQYEEKLQDSCRAKFSHEAITRDDDDSTNNYSYLTYYSQEDCNQNSFEAQRMLTSEPITLTGAAGSDCSEEMLCLVDFASVHCQELAQTRSVSIFVEVEVESRHTDEWENGDRIKFNSDGCTPSGLFPHCYFRYYTADEMETYSDGCDSIDVYSGTPSASLFTSADDGDELEGASWFFSVSPAPALQVSFVLLLCVAALGMM